MNLYESIRFLSLAKVLVIASVIPGPLFARSGDQGTCKTTRRIYH